MFSSLKYADFTFTNLPIYNELQTAKGIDSLASVKFTTPVGQDYVFSINKGPPIVVPGGSELIVDLMVNNIASSIVTIGYSTYTITAPQVMGW